MFSLTVNPENSLQALLHLRSNISLHFTWLFISSKAFFFFFILYICYRYGHIKLGRKDDVPEFTLLTYSCMIFATGVASGFFVYAVAEPLFHQHSNFYTNPQYRSQDEVDMFAINLTVNNWAITGWTGYTVVAVCMSLATHRFHLPFTARSCFYPILHHYTWGWIGDVIDGMTIVISIGGISTSLGLGAAEIVTGLVHLGFVDKYSRLDQMTSIQITTTWVITIICTASVISGVHGGIKLLSLIACAVGLMLLCTILLLDDTKFLLNLVVQEFGYFLQTSLFQLNFWTDAFGQLREGSGRAIDGKAAADWWMDAWTVFYVGWWYVY
jgi:choline/glycine/proline betaine transport protein